MFRIDNSTAVTSKPTRGAVGVKPGAFFQDDPAGGTVVSADFMNSLMDELAYLVEQSGITLDKASDTQLHAALLRYLQGTSTNVVNPFMNYLHVRDEKASGTNGGSFGANDVWVTRDLNTVKTNRISGASLASNQITLPVGTYRVSASVPAHEVDGHKAVLYDISGAAVLLYSTAGNLSQGGADNGTVFIKGEFTLGSSGAVEVRHIASNNGANGKSLGAHAESGTWTTPGVAEVYTEIEIYKLD